MCIHTIMHRLAWISRSISRLQKWNKVVRRDCQCGSLQAFHPRFRGWYSMISMGWRFDWSFYEAREPAPLHGMLCWNFNAFILNRTVFFIPEKQQNVHQLMKAIWMVKILTNKSKSRSLAVYRYGSKFIIASWYRNWKLGSWYENNSRITDTGTPPANEI